MIGGKGEVGASTSAVDEGEGFSFIGYKGLQVVEKGVDLFEFVAHRGANTTVVIHDAEVLEESVWTVVGEGVVLDAVVFAVGLSVGL